MGAVGTKETVAQMLRRIKDRCVAPCTLCAELRDATVLDTCHSECSDAWDALADRIEAEQADALEHAPAVNLLNVFDEEIEEKGWPKRKYAEHIGVYIDRCFLRLPLVDGEPLAKGMVLEGLKGPVELFCVYGDGSGEVYDLKGRLSFPEYGDPDRDSSLHLKRPDVLDADGVPVKVGDTVWLVPGPWCGEPPLWGFVGGEKCIVRENFDDGHRKDGRICVCHSDGSGYGFLFPSQVTHKKPDSMERVREYAWKLMTGYWGCDDLDCDDCPARVGGKTPSERYDTDGDCSIAQRLDLLARTERLMGGE